MKKITSKETYTYTIYQDGTVYEKKRITATANGSLWENISRKLNEIYDNIEKINHAGKTVTLKSFLD